MNIKPNANELLKQRRKQLGLTEAETARRMGLKTTQHYWNLENQKNRLTLEHVFVASKALNVKISFFCDEFKELI